METAAFEKVVDEGDVLFTLLLGDETGTCQRVHGVHERHRNTGL
jgi:hypothetical protein